MAHEITLTDRMFSVREMPWHYQDTKDRTTIFAEYPGREEAMVAAGHTWEAVEGQLLVATEPLPDWAESGTGIRLDDWKAIRRNDTYATLGITRKSYSIIQPVVMYEIQEAIHEVASDVPGGVNYETGGSMGGGRIVWTLSRLGEGYKVPGDDSHTFPYICVSTSFDGSEPLRADATDVRVVCANTFGFMKSKAVAGAGRAFVFRHTAKWRDRVEDARLALAGIREQHEAWVEVLHDLAERPLKKGALTDFVTALIPAPPKDLATERVMRNVEEARDSIRALVTNGRTVPGDHRDTAYGLFLAGTEYLDHVRVSRTGAEGRFNRSILNHDKTKDRVLRLARELSHAA